MNSTINSRPIAAPLVNSDPFSRPVLMGSAIGRVAPYPASTKGATQDCAIVQPLKVEEVAAQYHSTVEAMQAAYVSAAEASLQAKAHTLRAERLGRLAHDWQQAAAVAGVKL